MSSETYNAQIHCGLNTQENNYLALTKSYILASITLIKSDVDSQLKGKRKKKGVLTHNTALLENKCTLL